MLGFILAVSILGCNSQNENTIKDAAIADSTSKVFIPSSAAVENNKDSSRKFIRTADMKFKVKNVIQATYDIENITTRQGGFVTYTNLTSDIDYVTTTSISADSSLETSYYTVSNSIILRIPNTNLDTTLKELSRNINFLDYRIIKTDDVALQILSNNLTQERSRKNELRLINAIDNNKKALNETTHAEEVLSKKQEQADDAKVSNLSLKDQINFSTVNLDIYQRQTIKRELISNDKNIQEYQPPFGAKILDALQSGWAFLEALLIFLVKIWGPILLAIIAYFIYKKQKPKIKK